MYLILLAISFVLAQVIARGLFDRNWRVKAQENVDSIKNEKIFWYLMSQKVNAEKVFSAYLRTRNQKDTIRVGDCVMDESSDKNNLRANDLDISTIIEGDNIWVINSELNPKIEQKEKTIDDLLTENRVLFSEEEIRKSFKVYFDEHFWNIDEVQKNYNQFMINHLDALIKCDKTGLGIWKVLKDFSVNEHKFEFDRWGEKHIEFLDSLKLLQNDIKSFVIFFICEKIENPKTLKKVLTEWQQLQMLRWCVVDFSLWEIGKNKIQTSVWRLTTSLFL